MNQVTIQLLKMWLKNFWSPFYILVVLILSACSGEPETGPKEVKWDRDICERCRMVLSDPHFAAQIRYFPPQKKRSKVVKFDDIGCAVLWLEDKAWKVDEKTEIWVADHRTGDWINAETATYVIMKTTPMEYGLGAQPESAEGGLNYEQAKVHIVDVEERFNVHGLQLIERLKEQAIEREKLK